MLLIILLVNFSLADATVIEPNEQKEIKIGVTDIPHSLSPYALNSSNALVDQYSHLFFDPLVRWGKDRVLEYRLLADQRVLKNGEIRFSLKKNIYFHSGNLLTSKDVIWSFKEARSNKYLKRKLQYVINIRQVNKFQFDIETQLTQAQLLDYFTHLFILDSAYYQKNKISYNVVQGAIRAPIKVLPISGSGPYRVASFSPGLNLRVQASSNYWKDEPTFKRLNFLKIKSLDSRLYALLAGDLDISESISNKNINSTYFLESKNIYQIETVNALFLTINELNNDRLKRQTMRNAIHLAINQTGILKHILNGTGKVDNTFKLTAPAVAPPAYDASHAKYLFKKVGEPKMLSLLLMVNKFSHTDEVVFALKNMFKKVGIQLQVTEVESVPQWSKLQASYDMTLSTWRSGLIERSNVYQDIFTNSLIAKYVELLFKQQKKQLTMAEKIKLFEQYQLSDLIIPLFSKNKIWAADKKFELKKVFSVNAIPYWHLLTTKEN